MAWLGFARNGETIPAGAFVDVTEQAGLSAFRNVQGDSRAKPHILEVMGGGAAFLDYNNDGNLDILLVRGSTIEQYRRNGGDPVCALYRGDGKGHFIDVTQKAGLADAHGWGMGVTIADYDNDGWQDIFITGYGRNFLFHNRHDGTFEEVAEKAGVKGEGWSTGAAFGDFDRDGHLDLYVAKYLEYPVDHLPAHTSSCNYRGIRYFAGHAVCPARATPSISATAMGNSSIEPWNSISIHKSSTVWGRDSGL